MADYGPASESASDPVAPPPVLGVGKVKASLMGMPGVPIGPPLEIPDFTLSGVLPPFVGPSPTERPNMAPFETTLTRIARRMCGSDPRREIFRGLLTYRQRLCGIGVQDGFQWLSGSFLEDIEKLEKRDPRDVDVVTFVRRPAPMKDDAIWGMFVNANLPLFHPVMLKAAFKCDAYYVELDSPAENVVNLTRYWFGLFSHRRDGLWKGLLQIPLAVTADDADASILVQP